jgi:hypothetical protein
MPPAPAVLLIWPGWVTASAAAPRSSGGLAQRRAEIDVAGLVVRRVGVGDVRRQQLQAPRGDLEGLRMDAKSAIGY